MLTIAVYTPRPEQIANPETFQSYWKGRPGECLPVCLRAAQIVILSEAKNLLPAKETLRFAQSDSYVAFWQHVGHMRTVEDIQ